MCYCTVLNTRGMMDGKQIKWRYLWAAQPIAGSQTQSCDVSGADNNVCVTCSDAHSERLDQHFGFKGASKKPRTLSMLNCVPLTSHLIYWHICWWTRLDRLEFPRTAITQRRGWTPADISLTPHFTCWSTKKSLFGEMRHFLILLSLKDLFGGSKRQKVTNKYIYKHLV